MTPQNLPNPDAEEAIDTTLWRFARYVKRAMGGREVGGEQLDHDEAKAAIQDLIRQSNEKLLESIIAKRQLVHHQYCRIYGEQFKECARCLFDDELATLRKENV